METKDIIDSLANNDVVDAEKAFKEVMSQKVGDALEIKRREVANSFVKSTPTEIEDVEIWWHVHTLFREGWT